MAKKTELLTGIIVDEQMRVSFFEICNITYSSPDSVREMIEQGLLEPISGETLNDWYFTGTAVLRIQRARRLQRDLELNLQGTALALDLLDEIKELREHVAQLEKLLLPGG